MTTLLEQVQINLDRAAKKYGPNSASAKAYKAQLESLGKKDDPNFRVIMRSSAKKNELDSDPDHGL